MNKLHLAAFLAGVAMAVFIDYSLFSRYNKLVNRQGDVAREVGALAQAMVDVAEERCPEIFLDERVRRIIDKHHFDQIIRHSNL